MVEYVLLEDALNMDSFIHLWDCSFDLGDLGGGFERKIAYLFLSCTNGILISMTIIISTTQSHDKQHVFWNLLVFSQEMIKILMANELKMLEMGTLRFYFFHVTSYCCCLLLCLLASFDFLNLISNPNSKSNLNSWRS